MDPQTWARQLDRYEGSRPTPHRESVCNAPLTSMYFSAAGKVAPCWILLGHLDEYWSADRSISDIWNGDTFRGLRKALRDREFPGRCARCQADIYAGVQPLAQVYDREHDIGEWPNSLELELSNVCNYACEMCNGELSSKIRRDRDQLPPIDVPYDERFVDQVTELLPHLRHVRFSGGEPMLHPIVHEIADRIIDQRPDLRIDISTNGSILNRKVRHLLDRANVLINVSFDSFRPEVYEQIRVHADYGKLMANLEAYQEHFRTHPGLLTINTNPMRANWQEMPDFVRWCDDRDLFLTFNTVLHPEHLSLRPLPADELGRIHGALAEHLRPLPDTATEAERNNHGEFANLVQLIGRWHDEALDPGGRQGVPVELARPRRPELTEEALAELAEGAAAEGLPVLVLDLAPDQHILAVAPTPEVARSLGIAAAPGVRCDGPLDLLAPELAHPEVTMTVEALDDITNAVVVSSPDGLEVAVWTRQHRDRSERPTLTRVFLAVRSLPTMSAGVAP